MTADLRRLRLALHAFEMWVAVAALVTAITWFVPGLPIVSSRAIELVAPRIISVYSAMYGVGGGLTIVGLWKGSPRLEASGLVLLTTGIVVAAGALVAVYGVQAAVPGAMQLGAAVACVVRYRAILKGAS